MLVVELINLCVLVVVIGVVGGMLVVLSFICFELYAALGCDAFVGVEVILT